jgi:branched-chain amino acid transport system ATP-binding protein
MSVLRATGVTKRFGAFTALSDVAIDVAPNERHGLIGPNGSGKSTLLKILAGVERPTAGDVLLGDTTITLWSASRRARSGIALKFQVPRVFHELTVRENLEIAARGASAAADATFDLRAHADARARGLSHGQRQWLEIAMALATRPQVLLLDEPTAGMSPKERRETAELIRNAPCAVVIVEHDLPLVADIADQLTFLYAGAVQATGAPDEILSSEALRDVYTQRGRARD